MKENLLKYLGCPYCGNEFSLNIFKRNDEKIIDGLIQCNACSSKYLIIAGIPRFVPVSYLEFDKDFKKYLNTYCEDDQYVRNIYDTNISSENNKGLKKLKQNTSKIFWL